jgi:hypothetical protein
MDRSCLQGGLSHHNVHLFPLLFNLCLYPKGGVGDFGHEVTDILLLQTGLGSRPPSTAEVPQTTAT